MAQAPDSFFATIPRRGVLFFFAAVFCVFAPVGLLSVSSLAQPWPAWVSAAMLLMSGGVAVCWAGTFTLSRWYVVGIVALNLALAALASWASSTYDTERGLEGRVEMWIVVTLIVVGYALFVMFISGQGRTTLRLLTEMSLARDIHRTLVPPIELADGRLEVLGTSIASSEMGGDLIDLVRDGDRADLFLVDVSGHGVKAGVVMGMIKAMLRTSLRRGSALGELFTELNEVLEELTSHELYATAVGLRLEGSDLLRCAFAGHHHVLLWRAAGRRMEHLHDRALPLGMMTGQDYRTEQVQLASRDLLAVYTDGLSETMDGNGEELGHERIERCIVERIDRPLAEIQRAVFDLASSHGSRSDDQTLLMIRVCR
jgi:hypothetical protein